MNADRTAGDGPISAFVTRAVAEAPPMTEEHVARLRGFVSGGVA